MPCSTWAVRGLHPELTKMMGRLKYRYSYGENVLQHCIGSRTHLRHAGISDRCQCPKLRRRRDFLHDIGKALTHEVEGPHAEIGADLAAQYGVRDNIVVAIREHHDREMTTTVSFLVAAADAISAARPGARSDTRENYLQRLNELEGVARGFRWRSTCFRHTSRARGPCSRGSAENQRRRSEYSVERHRQSYRAAVAVPRAHQSHRYTRVSGRGDRELIRVAINLWAD